MFLLRLLRGGLWVNVHILISNWILWMLWSPVGTFALNNLWHRRAFGAKLSKMKRRVAAWQTPESSELLTQKIESGLKTKEESQIFKGKRSILLENFSKDLQRAPARGRGESFFKKRRRRRRLMAFPRMPLVLLLQLILTSYLLLKKNLIKIVLFLN